MTQGENKELLTTDNSYWVELDKALSRLEKNDDFQKVIKEGYIKDTSLRATSLLAVRPENKNELIAELEAVSRLDYYLLMIKRLSSSAIFATEDDE